MITIDQALEILARAKAQIGGDKLLILAVPDVDAIEVESIEIIDEVNTGGESQYVEVVAPACPYCNSIFCTDDNPACDEAQAGGFN